VEGFPSGLDHGDQAGGGMTWHRPAGGAAPAAGTLAVGAATADLRREHALLRRALAVLERAGRSMVTGHRVDAGTLTRLVAFLRTLGDQCHHAKEEGFLFPAMKQKGIASETPLGALLAEHAEERDYLGALSGHPSPAEQAAAALLCVQLMRDHIETEDQLVLPVADGVLAPAEQAVLAGRYAELEARTFGAGFQARIVAELEALERAIPG
jgi:hemerythrin-like domain-containing protein